MSTVEERGRVVTMRDKGRITIPASWRDRYGLSEGSEVVLVAEEDRLVLYPRRVQQLEGLLERIASALQEKGITLNELLENSAETGQSLSGRNILGWPANMASSVFVDSNVIFSAVLSKSGAPRRVLRLAAGGVVRLVISQQVEQEVRRNLETKAPQVAHLYPLLLQEANIIMVRDPSEETVREVLPYVHYLPDAMILAAAKEAEVDFFVTGDVKHFLSAAEVKDHVAFEILSPAEFLQRLESSQSS